MSDVATMVALHEELHPHAAGVGPSAVGQCRRRVAYTATATPEDEDYDGHKAAGIGKLLHLALAGVAAELWPAALVEHQVQLPGLERPGTLDLYADGVLTDYKSKSCHVFDAIAARGHAEPADIAQAGVYGIGLEDAGHPVDVLRIVYLNRCNGEELVAERPYDRAEAMAGLMRLHAVLDAVADGRELPRDEPGPAAKACELCPFRRRCWELDASHADARGPLSAKLEAEALEAALAYRRVQEAQEELEAERIRLRELLRGWDGHTFTDDDGVVRKIGWTRPKPPAPKLDPDEARLQLELHGIPVPMKAGKPASPALQLRAVKVAT